MTLCHCCRQNEAEYTVWSVSWINAADGVIYICKECLHFYKATYITVGKEAREEFESVKQFVRYTAESNESFSIFQKELLDNGDVFRGEKQEIGTLCGKVLIYYKESYWLVFTHNIVELGEFCTLANKLEW